MHTSYASLGFLYEAMMLGISFEILEGPGKGMGLAPYGNRSSYYDKLLEFVKIDQDKDILFYISLNGKITRKKEHYEDIYI